MPQLPVDSPLQFLAAILIIVGLLLFLLASFVEISNVTVSRKRWATLVGIIMVGGGVRLLYYPNASLEPSSVPMSSATSVTESDRRASTQLSSPEAPVIDVTGTTSLEVTLPPTLTPIIPTTIPVPTQRLIMPAYVITPETVQTIIELHGNDILQAAFPGFQLYYREFSIEGQKVIFMIPEKDNLMLTRCARYQDYPREFTIDFNKLSSPTTIYLLLNARFTFDAGGKVVGQLQFDFEDGRRLEYDLQLGLNIREWRIQASNTVVAQATSSDLVEVFRGTTYLGDTGVIDALQIDVPLDYRNAVIDSMTVKDVSLDSMGTEDPCLALSGIVVSHLK